MNPLDFSVEELEKLFDLANDIENNPAKSVQLLFDQGPETDKYDRLLAYVFVDGVSLHEILLTEGLAAVRYVNAPNDSLESELLAIQENAEKAKINIWAHENYLQRDGFHPEAVNK